jgi:hypothetical protein
MRCAVLSRPALAIVIPSHAARNPKSDTGSSFTNSVKLRTYRGSVTRWMAAREPDIEHKLFEPIREKLDLLNRGR